MIFHDGNQCSTLHFEMNIKNTIYISKGILSKIQNAFYQKAFKCKIQNRYSVFCFCILNGNPSGNSHLWSYRFFMPFFGILKNLGFERFGENTVTIFSPKLVKYDTWRIIRKEVSSITFMFRNSVQKFIRTYAADFT